MTRIAITGLGAVSPLGTDAPSTWAALTAGTSGVVPLDTPWSEPLTTRFAGLVDDSFQEALSVREIKRMDRSEQFTMAAGREAWNDAGTPAVDPERLAVVIGTGIGGIGTTTVQEHVLADKGPRRVSPHTVNMLMANGSAGWLSIDLGAKAGARTPVSACASGSEAIAMAREMILSGSADTVVAGGTEAAVAGLTMASFGQTRALSKRNDDPAAASRPFDADRDGFVLGEGAVVMVLEREDHANARGARIYGYVDGSSITSDAHDIVGADPDNQARTMRMAVRASGWETGDIGFVHAHATSTPAGDINETQAITGAGLAGVPVTSTKSMTGHLLGASGAVSTLATVMALRDGTIPPTTNLENQDPEIDLDVVANQARPTDARVAVVNSFGFGGHNVALVVSKA